jgi:hypothetical protein
MNFKEKAEERIEEWKTRAEELQLQLSLGRMEAIDELEKQKNNFKNFINDAKEKAFGFAENINPDKAKELREKFDDLQSQLAHGKTETKEAFEKQKEKINQGLDAVQSFLKENIEKAKSDDNLKTYIEGFEGKVEGFKTRLEAARLQFALGKADSRDEIEKNKEEIKVKLTEIRSKLDKNKEIAEEKWESFKNEMNEAFNHIKSAFSKL